MSDAELGFLPATAAAALIRRRKLSPVEYTEAVLRRIEAVQPALNCFVTVTAELARDMARKAEAAVMAGEPLSPLHGVPVSIKDLIPTAGIRTTFGTVAYADHVPDADDILVTRLKAAGAVIVGKTTTPEFGIKGQTDAPIYGVTRNPWNLARTPGGSSGGAAAHVAAGAGALALGTDGAGSTRGPAACCGLVGMKGTTGALPYQQAREVFLNPVAAGPLTRTIADAMLMQAVMAGPDPMDPWTHEAAPLDRVSLRLVSRDLAGLRIGYLRRCGNKKVAGDVEQNTLAALKAFEDMGAEVEEITAEIDWIAGHQRVLYLSSIAHNLGPVVEKYGEKTDHVLRAFVAAGKTYDLAAYIQAVNARTRLFRAVQSLFSRYDVIMSPTLTRTALDADYDSATGSVEIEGEALGSTQPEWTGYLYPFNLTGHPALSVPSGFGDDALPTALQIIGPRHRDADLFRLGALLEEARPWTVHRPQLAAA